MKQRKTFWYERLFDSIGKNYLEYDYTKGTLQEVDFITHLIQDKSARILDVGCGPGRHSLEMAKRGYHMIGLDLSKRFLQIGKEGSTKNNLDCCWLNADARYIPFVEAFDWALCLCEGAFGILEDDSQNRRVLQQISDCLKPGGKLLLNVLNASFIYRHPSNDDHLDIKNNIGYWTENYTNELGVNKSEKCWNRYYTFTEIKLLLELVDLKVLDGWGTIAGEFEAKELDLDDFEILVFAEKKFPSASD